MRYNTVLMLDAEVHVTSGTREAERIKSRIAGETLGQNISFLWDGLAAVWITENAPNWINNH